jgi:iron(III) transport system ATP-binding protein
MEIRIRGLTRDYFSEGKRIRALDDVSLTVPANRIFTLLGPSGCGKTTLLRCIVGLEIPDSGEIAIGDDVVWSKEKGVFVPPEKRGLGMVFQTYAIWPHMDVFDNVAYPLKCRKVPAGEFRERVARFLKFVRLEGFESRPATRLSGGQQQRVALARALVAEPKVILFDEPLSNLDAKLREETRKELRTFLSSLGITAVYVTHDRVEALALSDRIAVMRAGRIVEEGDPKKIYFRSDSRFVADFIGRANLIPGKLCAQDGARAAVDTAIGRIVGLNPQGIPPGTDALACVRPEFLRVARGGAPGAVNAFPGTVETLLFVGEAYEGEVRVGGTRCTGSFPPAAAIAEGGEGTGAFDADHCFVLPA